MPFLTLGQAAKQAGVVKTTLTNAIKSGQLSVFERVGTSYRIDPAELDRWMKGRGTGQSNAVEDGRNKTPEIDTSAQVEIRMLREMLEAAYRQAEKAERRADRAEEQADRWREQAAKNLHLIEHLTSKPEPAPLSWWDRLRGKSRAA